MNKWLHAILACLLYVSLTAQTVNWQWARPSSGPGKPYGNTVATDQVGNVYTAGFFQGPGFFFGDSAILNADTPTKAGYLLKCNSEGQTQWIRRVGAPGFMYLDLVATDTNGNAYCAGISYSDTLIFGDSVFTNSSNGMYAITYIVKYDSSGAVLWSSSTFDSVDTYLDAIAADAMGNVYLTGYFLGSHASFGSVDLYNASGNGGSLFVTKYSSTGNAMWAKTTNPPQASSVQGIAIAADNSGNIFVTGAFTHHATFDSITLNGHSWASTYTIFVAKYDSSGVVLWANSAGGDNGSWPQGITIDRQGNVCITGSFANDTAYFGSDTLINTTATNNNAYTSFVAKYNSDGNLSWAKCNQGNDNVTAQSIAADTNGNFFITGWFSNDSVFAFDSTYIAPPYVNTGPLFILALDATGNILCHTVLDRGFGANGDAVCTDQKGNAYINSTFIADTFTLGNDTFTHTGGDNIFLAKFNCTQLQVNINTIDAAGAELALYPNPFNNQARVEYLLPAESKHAALIIYDMLGRQQNTYPLPTTAGEIIISASTLSSGLYLYSLVADGRVVISRKLVVE